MAKQVQLRRGTTAQHATFTGAVGEVTVDTDKKTPVVHDGATAGGKPIAPPATESLAGVMEEATVAEVRSAATTQKAVTSEKIETASALVALTDAATVAIDWDAGINFSLTVTANRIIGNPTNGQVGTWRTVLVQGDSGTDRTITFGNQHLGSVPAITDCDDAKWYLLTIFCITTTHFTTSSKQAK